jgi:hypothetical protein
MLILGIVLLVIGYFTGISILYTIGAILAVIGLVLLLLGHFGGPDRRYAGRRYWY